MADRPVANLPRAAALLVAGVLLAGCTAQAGPAAPQDPGPGAAPSPPPAPPAACLLDTAAMATVTGLQWTPDATTASDVRCVYDPAGGPVGAASPFVAVDIAPAAGAPATELDTIAALCDTGSRAPVAAADGFVCRFQGGSVFAALVRGDEVVTVAASAVPPGTTAERLARAFTEQLGALDS